VNSGARSVPPEGLRRPFESVDRYQPTFQDLFVLGWISGAARMRGEGVALSISEN
jgi:hypothetical protein